jgi:two-component system OmpR family sensor kinase
MRSLFVQLWAAFLLVVALTFGASMGGVYLMAVERAAGLDSNVFPQTIAQSAQQVLSARGPDGIASWTISQNHERPELQIYFVDSRGREMLNRKVRGRPLPGSTGMLPPVVRAPDGTTYRMLVRRTSNLVFDFWDVFFRPWMVLGLTLMISALGSAWLAWEMSRPVRRLRLGVRAVAAGNLNVDIGGRLARRRDELGGLARDFGQMTKDLRAHIAAREELLRDVSHELRSPLARLRLAADLACSGRGDRKRLFDRIEREVERIDAMIGQILHFSRVGAGRPLGQDQVELAQLLEEIVEDAQIEADNRGVAIRLVADNPGHARGDRSKLRSAIENVLRNALRHAPPGSEVVARLERVSDGIRIEVRDKGPGVQIADADWIFEPFHRGDGSEGTGLGLAITRRIMELHGGHACAANGADGGLCVELRLPGASCDSSD